jgi:hypothetical protein
MPFTAGQVPDARRLQHLRGIVWHIRVTYRPASQVAHHIDAVLEDSVEVGIRCCLGGTVQQAGLLLRHLGGCRAILQGLQVIEALQPLSHYPAHRLQDVDVLRREGVDFDTVDGQSPGRERHIEDREDRNPVSRFKSLVLPEGVFNSQI